MIRNSWSLSKMSGGGSLVCWAFDFKSWQPSRDQWCRAMRRIQPEERARILDFRYRADAKASAAGRLLLQRWVDDLLSTVPAKGGLQGKVKFGRSDRGRPYLLPEHAEALGLANGQFDFNLAHAGDLAVFAAFATGPGTPPWAVSLGVDVMPARDGARERDKDEFFRLMRRQLTPGEWAQILDADDVVGDPDSGGSSSFGQLERFFRFWCLKESFVKADGRGLSWDLGRLEFRTSTPLDQLKRSAGSVAEDTVLLIDGAVAAGWTFFEQVLPWGSSAGDHLVATALNLASSSESDQQQQESVVGAGRFRLLSPEDLLPSDGDGEVREDPVEEDWWWDSFQKQLALKPF